MFKNLTVQNTIKYSLILQFLSGVISLHGIFIKIPKEHIILTDILKLDTFVQFIELIFYIWAFKSSVKIEDITSKRYIDWTITTPIMLISTIMFMKYQEYKEQNKLDEKHLNTNYFFKNNKILIKKIVLNNLCMLIFGYLGEVNILPKFISILIGFYFFAKSFSLIYYNYAIYSKVGKQLFNFLFIVWSLYGVAAFFPIIPKNISYNLLDIISKNFYGIYIYYKVLQVKK